VLEESEKVQKELDVYKQKKSKKSSMEKDGNWKTLKKSGRNGKSNVPLPTAL
jgi:hypothetical protein